MPAAPLGLAYILANIDQRAHQVDVLDMMFQENPNDTIKDAIQKLQPKLIGLSIRNFDELDMASRTCYLHELKACVDIIRQSSQSLLILGGAGFTIMPKQLMAYLEPDLGIVGEGEKAFPELLNRIEGNIDYKNLPGLIFKENNSFKMNKPIRIEDLDNINPPDRSFIDLQKYAQNNGFAGTISKKGCPQGCIWCPSPYYPGKKVTLRDPVKVVDEIEKINKEYGIPCFYFCDDIFNNPPEHAKAVCDEIISRKLKIVWGCDLNPATVNKDLLISMKRSGCAMVAPHFISFSNKMLNQMTTGFSTANISDCCQLLEEVGLPYTPFVILGGPGETRGTIEESISFSQSINPAVIFTFIGLRIIPRAG
jgi:radical SAM superfamily enzyme YgiQ (UPF0313 family)